MLQHLFIAKTPNTLGSLSKADLAPEHEDPAEGYLRKLGSKQTPPRPRFPVSATPLPQTTQKEGFMEEVAPELGPEG